MPDAQLEIRDANGNVLINQWTSAVKISPTTILTNGTNGWWDDDFILKGVPFAMIYIYQANNYIQVNPVVTFSGNRISWTYQSQWYGTMNHRILYGIY